MNFPPKEIEEINSLKVACKGSSTNMSEGHPKVWLKIPPNEGSITCPYCEKKFILRIKD
tara:strand:+ start:306 stop:482 length:177 start_codon:yes stop_codon:yes gene_type:complete